MEIEINQVTEKIIGCCYKVANGLGHGFLEKVYENALAYELEKAGLQVHQQSPLEVQYEGIVVGEFYADIIVNQCVIVELKTVNALTLQHFAQCLNYLKATGMKLCLLINFGKLRVEVKRIVR